MAFVKHRLEASRLGAMGALALLVFDAEAFPPYRSTDADTADPYIVQLRLGIFDVDYRSIGTDITSPMIHANLGLPHGLELTSELEYAPEPDEIAEGAVGLKWVPLSGESLSFGMEALVLLPVRPGDSGSGLEYKFISTWWRDNTQLHLNAGGFDDTRISPAEKGWEASVLVELLRDSYVPGVEISAELVSGKPTEISAGVGSIFEAGRFTVRIGLHAGVTEEAPDMELNFWITTELPLRR